MLLHFDAVDARLDNGRQRLLLLVHRVVLQVCLVVLWSCRLCILGVQRIKVIEELHPYRIRLKLETPKHALSE